MNYTSTSAVQNAQPLSALAPLVFFATAFLLDLAYFATADVLWTDMAFWVIGFGLLAAVYSTLASIQDWFDVFSKTPKRWLGFLAELGNLATLFFFAASWSLRFESAETPNVPAYLCSFGGLATAICTAWVGSRLMTYLTTRSEIDLLRFSRHPQAA